MEFCILRLTLCSNSALLLSHLFCVLCAPVKFVFIMSKNRDVSSHLSFNTLLRWLFLPVTVPMVLENKWLYWDYF